MYPRLLVRTAVNFRVSRPSRFAWITYLAQLHHQTNVDRTKSTSGFGPYVDNAINAQEDIHTLKESTSKSEILVSESTEMEKLKEIDVKQETQRQWQWAVAEEMLPASKDARTSQILEEVGQMEVWMESVADRVKNVKAKLDDMEEEGGVILHLKDS